MPIITPAQCRAARAWVRMTQLDLADRSLVSLPTLVNFERGKSVPGEKLLKGIATTLKKAGVAMVFDSAGNGVGIKG